MFQTRLSSGKINYQNLAPVFGLALTLSILFAAPLAHALSPMGYVDTIDTQGNVQGWAYDPDSTTTPVTVHFYADGPYNGGGTFLGFASANIQRLDVNQEGYAGNHGFNFKIPAPYNTGGQPIYMYAIDLTHADANTLLINSPKKAGTVVDADGSISSSFKGKPIVMRTSNQYAGAFYSVTWDGVEFINVADHGRQLQSAAVFNGLGEFDNPTEAGSWSDGLHATSSSVALSYATSANSLTAKTLLAYWEPYKGNTVSDVTLSRKVTMGFQGLPNVIEYLTSFHIPDTYLNGASFEGLTGYMPMFFSQFYSYEPGSQKLTAMTNFSLLYTDGYGSIINTPVIFSSADGKYAMGVYSPDSKATYFYVTHHSAQVQKWDCDRRIENLNKQTPGDINFRCYIAVGSLQDVEGALSAVYGYFNDPKGSLGGLNSGTTSPILQGWAYDPKSATSSIYVHMYVDGPTSASNNNANFAGYIKADGLRPDVDSAMSITGNHGFLWPIPAKFQGASHTFYAYGINTDPTGPNPLLVGAPITIAVPIPGSCTFGGKTLTSGQSVSAYKAATVSYGSACASETRTCVNGSLSGSNTYASCSAAVPANCSFNGGTISSGKSVTAYLSSSVAYGSQCSSQLRTCANGTLSGSYTNGSCVVAAAPVRDPIYNLSYQGAWTAHLSTASQSEESSLVANGGWRLTGIIGYLFSLSNTSQPQGTLLLRRFYNSSTGAHLLTYSTGEIQTLPALGYKEEGAQGYVYSPLNTQPVGTVALYRLRSLSHPDYYYTTSATEYQSLSGAGWAGEGVLGYIFASGVAASDSTKTDPLSQLASVLIGLQSVLEKILASKGGQ